METSKYKWKRIKDFFYPNENRKMPNWNNLMDAVEKVEMDDMEVSIIDNECEIGTNGYYHRSIISEIADTKKQAVFNALNNYVIWYLTERKDWIVEGKI